MDRNDAYQILGQMPHCDQLILHKPTTCEVCDARQDWQALRVMYGINFTGENDPDKSPCPSEKLRATYLAHRWPGNRPTNIELTEADLNPPTYAERLLGDD